MKLLHAADLHVGDTTYGFDRLDDHRKLISGLVDSAISEKVDLVIFAGDVFHHRDPGPNELLVLAEALTTLRNNGIPTVITPGNHDGNPILGDWRGKVTGWLGALQLPLVHAYPDPRVVYLQKPLDDLVLYTLPYAHKRSFPIEPGSDARTRLEHASRSLERIIEELPPAPGNMTLFVGHLSVLGNFLKAESAMKIGWDLAIRPELLERFSYAALGHIHRQQQVGRNAWYAGSPMQMKFEEGHVQEGDDVVPGQAKGWLIVWLDRQTREGHEFVSLNVTPVVSDTAQYWTLNVVDDLKFYAEGNYVKVLLGEGATAAQVESVRRQALKAGARGAIVTVAARERDRGTRARADIRREMSPVDALQRWLTVKQLPQEPYLAAGRTMLEDEGWTQEIALQSDPTPTTAPDAALPPA